jgi:nucleotide-binding universal stress UspA family protein
MYKYIVHANDGSDNSFRALEAALELAKLCDAKLDILFVEEIHPRSGTIYEAKREKAAEDRRVQQRRHRLEEAAAQRGVGYKVHVFHGQPVAHIVEFVHECKADLLVIGASEHVSMIELVIGRRSDRIAHYAKCSVLIAR